MSTLPALFPRAGRAPVPVPDWPLWHAQRVFAGVVETPPQLDLLARARLRRDRRRTLSALSADTRAELARWLALRVAALAAHHVRPAETALLRIDRSLARAVAAALPAARARLRGGRGAA